MKDLMKYKLNIQLFAADNGANGGASGGADGDEGAPPADPQQEGEEKTFTQKEVDAIVAREKKRAAKNATPQTPAAETPKDENPEGDQNQDNPYIAKYAQSEIKVSMVQNGIDASKVNRAVRLVDHTTVLDESGEVDAEKLNNAIAELIKEWPELKTATSEEGKPGFKIGSDNSNPSNKEDDAIAKAFGNIK